MIPKPLYLTSYETAQLLKLSTRTLERMRVTGGGPRFMKAGTGKRSRVLYKSADIESWLEGNSYQSTSEYDGA